jgi:hypothetical protein
MVAKPKLSVRRAVDKFLLSSQCVRFRPGSMHLTHRYVLDGRYVHGFSSLWPGVVTHWQIDF